MMNIIIKTVCTVVAAGMFCGCTATTKPDPVAPGATPTFGTITLIRTEAEPTAPSVQVLVDYEIVAVVDNHSHATFELPPGTHFLTFNWPDTPITFDDEVTVELEGNDHKYISVLHRIEIPEYVKTEDSTDYTMIETLAAFELPAKFARGVIKNLDESRDARDELKYHFSD